MPAAAPVPAPGGSLPSCTAAAGRAGVAPARMPGWDPAPIEAVLEYGGASCSECGTALVWAPGGTLLLCRECDEPVFPPELAPAAADTRADPRRVATQTERDTAALTLAERRAVLKQRISATLKDDRLEAASRGRLDWYLAEVGKAQDMDRLRALGELLTAERLAYRGGPTVIAARIEGSDADDREEPALSWSAAAAELLGGQPRAELLAPATGGYFSGRLAPSAGRQDAPQPGQMVPARMAATADYRPCQGCRTARRWGPDGRWPNAVARIETDRPVAGLPDLTTDVCGYCLTLLDARQVGYGIAERYPAGQLA